MSDENFLLTFELSEDCTSLEIHSDEVGLELLEQVCSRLRKGHGHEHLMTPAWGGQELSEEKQGARWRQNQLLSIARRTDCAALSLIGRSK